MLFGARAALLTAPPVVAVSSYDPATLFAAYSATVGGIYVRNMDPSRQVNGLSRLFTTAGGGTPVASLTDTIGLVLDESQGCALGSELVVNGGFASDTVWSKGTDWVIAAGVASRIASAGASNLSQAGILTIGRVYRIRFDATLTAGALGIFAGVSGTSDSVGVSGSYTRYAVCQGDTALYFQGNAAFAGTVDNVSVMEVLGNHMWQQTGTARPALAQSGATFVASGDGVDDHFMTSVPPGGGAITGTTLIKVMWTVAGDYVFGGQDPSTAGRWWGILNGSPAKISAGIGNQNQGVNFDAVPTFPDEINVLGVFAMRRTSAPVNQIWWRRPAGALTNIYSAAGDSVPAASTNPMRVMGGTATGGTLLSGPLAGYMAGLFHIRAALTDAEVQQVADALAAG